MSGSSAKALTLYSQVVIKDLQDEARVYQLLLDFIQNPAAAAAVRTVVARDELVSYGFKRRTTYKSPRNIADETLISKALKPLDLGEDESHWLEVLTQTESETPPVAESDANQTSNDINGPLGDQRIWHGRFAEHATVLLLTLCPNVEHLVFDDNFGDVLTDFLHRNNYGRLPRQYLQNLRHVTALPGSELTTTKQYAYTDPLGSALCFHRLPCLETFSIRSVEENYNGMKQPATIAVPHTSSLKSISITNSDLTSLVLASYIRMPRALETFMYGNGGEWGRLGGHPGFSQKTVAKALWTQRNSLREIDIACECRVSPFDASEAEDTIEDDASEPAEPWQEEDIILDHEIEYGGPEPLCPSELPNTRPYKGSIGSLHDFVALKRLSIGVNLLLGAAEVRSYNVKPDGQGAVYSTSVPSVYDAPFRLIDGLPPSLEYLEIRGYKKGQHVLWDEQIDELMLHKDTRLPNLRTIKGVTEYVESDIDLEERSDLNAPGKPPSSYDLFIADMRPSVKREYPSWEVSKRLHELWTDVSDEERAKLDYRSGVDHVRYYMQKMEYDAQRPFADVSSSDAEGFYKRYLKVEALNTDNWGARGRARGLEAAVRLAKDAGLSVDRISRALEEQDREIEREEEEGWVRTRGPEYEWIELKDDSDNDGWVKIEHEAKRG